MAYTTQQAVSTLDSYLGIPEDRKEYIEDTKNRGFVLTLDSGEKVVIFVYPLVHKQDNTKNYFDTRDSGAYERGVAWKYALKNGLKYFCFGVNDQVDKFNDYVFSLECNETIIERISGTKDGSRNGPGNQIIIPNDYVPQGTFERIQNRLGIYISAIRKDGLLGYIMLYDNRPYMQDIDIDFVEEEDPEERNKRLFEYWMSLQKKPANDSDAGEPYSESTISQYVTDIKKTMLPMNPDRTVFYTSDSGEVQITIETLQNSPDKYAPQITAVKKYLEYLIAEEEKESYEDILDHSLWGLHIKNKNNALSEENPHVCIGWSAMGDLTGIENDADITRLYEQAYPNNTNNRSKGQDVGQIRRFTREVNVGDYIIYAESDIFHIGRVESEYYYDTSENPNQNPDYVNNRRVTWLKKNVSRKILSKQMHKSLATSMSIFGINDYRAAVVDILRGTYKKDDDIDEIDEIYDELKYVSGFESHFKRNRILFGAPGTGKSFKLNKECKDLLGEGNETDYERVTFHPDYSYANFVGTYKPVMVKNESTWEADEDKKEVIAILKDKSKSAQEKYDLLYDRFKADGLTRLPVLLGLYCDDNFKTRKQDGTDAVGDNSVERNHGRAIRPYVNLDAEFTGKKEIAYEYVPGPFMRVLVKALKSCMDGSNKPYLLVVEEINRANVAAVFGDVFQLLDRDGDNISEYPIATTNDMRTYLAEQLGVDESAVETIKIPDNMFIWATMNSADQGVFPMDTAFKRRWDFTYLGIDDAVEEFSEKIVNRKYVLGKKSFARLVTWNDLRTAINETLSSDTFNINEDKLLGPYFIAKTVLESDNDDDFIDVFKNKVLMYLFDDAVKQKRKTFFEECSSIRYSEICKQFDDKGVFIFPAEISKQFTETVAEQETEDDTE